MTFPSKQIKSKIKKNVFIVGMTSQDLYIKLHLVPNNFR